MSSRYENIIFKQDENALEAFTILEEEGPEAVKTFLQQWHYPGEHEVLNHAPWCKYDHVIKFEDGYILSYNLCIGYISLDFELQEDL